MTTLKATTFYVVALFAAFSSCYGQSASNITNVTESDACANRTSCSECFELDGCTFTLRNCSSTPDLNRTESLYECVNVTTINITVTEASNCTVKDAAMCKTTFGDIGNGTDHTTTPSPDLPQTLKTNPGTPDESTTAAVDVGTVTTSQGPETTTPAAPQTTTNDSNTTAAAVTTVAPETSTTPAPGESTPGLTTEEPSSTSTPSTKDDTTTPEQHQSSTDGHPSTSGNTDIKPSTSRHFDAPSFIGGIILSVGLLAIAFVGYKFYRARTEHNYHTL